eukprot:m.166075 g.166075  ORF g.166075 m.166075 type:complete len:321 (+) comp14440_c0_seq1:2836-3798(+)
MGCKESRTRWALSKTMVVFAAVSGTLNRSHNLNLLKLGLEVFQSKHSAVDTVALDDQLVVFSIDVWHGVMVTGVEQFVWCEVGLGEEIKTCLATVRLVRAWRVLWDTWWVILVGIGKDKVGSFAGIMGIQSSNAVLLFKQWYNVTAQVKAVNIPKGHQVVTSSHFDATSSPWMSIHEGRHIIDGTLERNPVPSLVRRVRTQVLEGIDWKIRALAHLVAFHFPKLGFSGSAWKHLGKCQTQTNTREGEEDALLVGLHSLSPGGGTRGGGSHGAGGARRWGCTPHNTAGTANSATCKVPEHCVGHLALWNKQPQHTKPKFSW